MMIRKYGMIDNEKNLPKNRMTQKSRQAYDQSQTTDY